MKLILKPIVCIFLSSNVIASQIDTITVKDVDNSNQNLERIIQTNINRGIITRLLEKEYPEHLVLYPYETNYLVHTYANHLNKESIQSYDWSDNAKRNETKFQLSLAFPLYRGILGENTILAASYTQRSWWQSTNPSESSPFRETNYEPQLFVGVAPSYFIGQWELTDLEFGFNHQSNGREENTSRSWNRLYVRARIINGNTMVDLKTWYRIHESSHSDDNPNMTRYLGYYRLMAGQSFGEHVFSLQSHYNWNTGYGNAQFSWSYPLMDSIRVYSQLFSGYGESMIDYDYKQTRLGLGIILNDVF